MPCTQFNWDHYFATAKYSEVRESAAYLSYRRHPTTYSPDRRWLYLSSQEQEVDTSHVQELKSMQETLATAYRIAKTMGTHEKMSLIRIDHTEVCILLRTQIPDEYVDPDELLAE